MYNVAEIEVAGQVFYTCRTDDRTPEEVVADGITGYQKQGARSPIYEELNRWQKCHVTTVFRDLHESEAKAKQKTLIEYARAIGRKVLNVKD